MPDHRQIHAPRPSAGLAAAPVLLYHRVTPDSGPDPHGLSVPLASFSAQLSWLAKRGYTTPASAEWLRSMTGPATSQKKLLFTFDDAYSDLATHALPLLKQYGFSAIIFVVTGHIGGVNAWDDSSLRLMNADEIRHWSSQGFEFASHSHLHRDLRTLSPDEIDTDLQHSISAFQALGIPRSHAFAYPYGQVDESVSAVVRRHFQCAFTTEDGLNTPGTDAYRLRRSMVLPNDSLVEFTLRVKRGRNPLARARSWFSPFKRILSAGDR